MIQRLALPAAMTALAAAGSLLAGCATAQPAADPQTAAIDALVADAQSSAPYPGLAVSVRRGDTLIYEAAYGEADLEQHAAATPDTVFQIGSITKSFTALMIAQLAAEGRIDIEAPISTYLPDYSGPARDVPVRDLMNHTAGLVNYTALPDFPQGSQRTVTREIMRDYFEDADLLFEPGTAFSYSNSGTYTLGLIIEAVTGQTYDAALAERVLEPLGLDRTYYAGYERVIEGRAEGYVVGEDGFLNAPQLDPLVPFSAGALLSTVQDIQDYIDQVQRQNVFGDAVRDMLYEQVELGGDTLAYALGALVIRDWEGHRKIAHAGDIDGFAAYMSYYPDEDLSIVVMGSTRDVAPTPVGLEQKIARIVFDQPRPTPSIDPLADSEIAAIAGNYDASYMRIGIDRIGILPREGGIAFRIGGVDAQGPAIPLLHLEGRTFLAAHDDEMVFSFSPEDGGTPEDLTVDWLGGGIPFVRAAGE
ncbi:serine hydrolase domain-containing protein [Maricaulis sp.]|uniref:serine hydrolase domain-containing protein n=1 Tax=Maricaulis sp. TaxID=1486257 RepID=UPI003510D92C